MKLLRHRTVVALALCLASTTTLMALPDSAAAAGRSFHVGCNGSDKASGRSASQAWRSITRANVANVRPGDRLLLQRGCTWNGQRLDVTWSGTASRPVVVANYGSGAKPMIRNGKNSSVKITGSHVTINGLRVDHDNLRTVACNQPVDDVYGFNVTGGAHHVSIRYSEASGSTAGIHLSQNSHSNLVKGNKIFDNDVLTSFGSNPAKDLGAWGVLVRSDDNRITDNDFWGNRARCRNQGYKLMSNSVEIYEGDDNLIDRNRSTGDRVFSELGSSANDRAEGNVFEFNVFDSDVRHARFITTRGAGVEFGPVRSTRVLHNTVHLDGAQSEGIVCGGECGSGILELRNNIIAATGKTIYASGNATVGPNVIWNPSGGEAFIQIGSNGNAEPQRLMSKNPRFVNASGGDFRLQGSSPAIGAADGARVHNNDVTGQRLDANVDIGAFDH